MLPHIHVQNGYRLWKLVWQHFIIVCLQNHNTMLTLVVGEPAPTTSMNFCGSVFKSFLKVLPGIPSFQNVAVELITNFWSVTVSWWTQRIPEELMIVVRATPMLDVFGEFDNMLEVIICLRLFDLCYKLIKIVDTWSVMLWIMEFHQVTRNYWLQCTKIIWQMLELNHLVNFLEWIICETALCSTQ